MAWKHMSIIKTLSTFLCSETTQDQAAKAGQRTAHPIR
jgi:hypothetical protein